MSAPAGAEHITFKLNAIHFSDSHVFSQQELDGFVAPYLGKTISVMDLFKFTAKINQVYRNRGYLTAQAVLIPQDIKGGKVNINLIEGRIGDVTASGNKYVSSSFIISRVGLKIGTIPTIKLLEKKVSVVNWNHDYKISADLKPGKKSGTTDLNLAVSEEPKPFSGSVYFDNHGSKNSGLYNLGLTGTLYSAFGYDEKLTFGAMTSQSKPDRLFKNVDVGSFFIDLNLPLPIGNGTVYALYSHSNSSVMDGPFQSLGVSGRGDFGSFLVSQPVYSTPYYNIVLLGGVELSKTRSTVGIVNTDTLSNRFVGGVKGQMNLPSSGTYITSELRLIQSMVNIKGLSGPEYRNINRFVGSVVVVQGLGNGFTLTTRAAGQYSPQRRLPSGEQWYLGGTGSLPGYEVSSISGDTGFYVMNQIRYTSADINDSISQALGQPFGIGVKALFDLGGVYDDYVRAYEGNLYSDVGVGLDFKIANHLSGDMTVAWPIDPGNDADLKINGSPRIRFSLRCRVD